jgi:AcrR family transcriptional regulator
MRTSPAREKLLESASALFYEEGIGATAVDDVVRAAGVSKPTLYAHFGSKSELVAAVLARRHAARVEELAAIEGGPLAVFAWLEGFYAREGARGCAFLNAAAELPEPGPGRDAAAREKAWLREELARRAREAGARAPERLGSQLALLVDGVAARVVVDGHAAAPTALADASAAARALMAAAG